MGSPGAYEKLDAKKVNEAFSLIAAGNLIAAKQILAAVINNTPTNYAHTTKVDENTFDMRFWDQREFIHFVTWQKPTQNINALLAAYPRAYYYLGFIANAEGDFQAAIDLLDRGSLLEPTNPNFVTEKAHALIRLGQYPEAVALCNQISELGPFVSGQNLAIALRAKGAALVEMGDLFKADEVYRESLKYDPVSKLAVRELRYIENLLFSGGLRRAPLEVNLLQSKPLFACQKCGATNVPGHIFVIDNLEYFFCNVCKPKSDPVTTAGST